MTEIFLELDLHIEMFFKEINFNINIELICELVQPTQSFLLSNMLSVANKNTFEFFLKLPESRFVNPNTVLYTFAKHVHSFVLFVYC